MINPDIIQKVWVLNLKCQPDRQQWAYGNLAGLGFPYNRIVMHEGHLWSDFESKGAVKEAAKADGFAFFRDKWLGDDTGGQWYSMCLQWGVCSILREITKQPPGFVGMYMLDDMILFAPWVVLNRITADVVGRNPKFHIIMLRAILPNENFPHPSRDIEHLINLTADDGFAIYSDFASIVTPAGARRMLAEIVDEPWAGFPGVYQRFSLLNDTTGLYTTSAGVITEIPTHLVSQTHDPNA